MILGNIKEIDLPAYLPNRRFVFGDEVIDVSSKKIDRWTLPLAIAFMITEEGQKRGNTKAKQRYQLFLDELERALAETMERLAQ